MPPGQSIYVVHCSNWRKAGQEKQQAFRFFCNCIGRNFEPCLTQNLACISLLNAACNNKDVTWCWTTNYHLQILNRKKLNKWKTNRRLRLIAPGGMSNKREALHQLGLNCLLHLITIQWVSSSTYFLHRKKYRQNGSTNLFSNNNRAQKLIRTKEQGHPKSALYENEMPIRPCSVDDHTCTIDDHTIEYAVCLLFGGDQFLVISRITFQEIKWTKGCRQDSGTQLTHCFRFNSSVRTPRNE